MWYQGVINFRFVNLFEILYIHLPDGKNNFFCFEPCKRHKYVVVLMSTVAIPDPDVKVCTRRNYSTQGKNLRYSTQP